MMKHQKLFAHTLLAAYEQGAACQMLPKFQVVSAYKCKL